jgi:2-polyprenyl-6-methoxyphenol hydroxylase-like FAD-dependent oxidoreductase
MPSWHAGRVVLLGDAAHATTPNLGQGGCQAIEDAFVLAQCLAERSSPQHAFEAYQRTRKPKADRITATSRRIGAAVHLRHGWQRAARDAALRALPRSFGVRQAEFIYQLNF